MGVRALEDGIVGVGARAELVARGPMELATPPDMTDDLRLPSDRQLVDATRSGSTTAWIELRSRHESAVEAVARRRRDQGGVDPAFERLRGEIVDGDLSIDAVDSEYAVRAIRPRVIALMTGGTYGPVPPQRSGDLRVGGGGELAMLAVAFGQLSDLWQTALWHHLVDLEPAARTTTVVGRTAAETVALQDVAERGLFDRYTAVESVTPGAVVAQCQTVVPLLGGYRRGTLPIAQRRAVDDHLDPDDGTPGCTFCRRRLNMADSIGVALPRAIVPGLTGLPVDDYRTAIGAIAGVMGASAYAAQRSTRANRWARVGAVVAIVLALLAAAFVIRSPFDDLEGEFADLIERSTTTTVPSVGPDVTGPPSENGGGDTDFPASRVELVFPGVPQGLSYVPGGPSLDLDLSMSTPAPVYRNGTGTIDVVISNNAEQSASVSFVVRPTSGVTFDELTEGDASCEPNGAGATCELDIGAGGSAPLSLRVALDSTVEDRLIVVSSIRSQALDLPIETVPGLAIGTVAHGQLGMIANTLGACSSVAPGCPRTGYRNASSAPFVLGDGAVVEQAVLLWQGGADAPGWATTVGLMAPGDSTATSVDDASIDIATTTGFRSRADVTELVRRSGAGTYTVVRPPSLNDPGDGSWTLVVVTRHAGDNRRLLVVVDPDRQATPATPAIADIPVKSAKPAGPPRSAVRPVTLQVSDAVEPIAAEVRVDGVLLAPAGSSGAGNAYAFEIDSSADEINVAVSTSTRPVIGLAVDIVT